MNNFYNKTNNGGYIALISAIIISFILISLTFTVSASGYFSRTNVSYIEYKRVSLGLAESCANAALLKVAQNYNYTPPLGGDVVRVGTEICTILKVTNMTEVAGRRTTTVFSRGIYRGAFSNIKVSASVSNPSSSIVALGTPLSPVITVYEWGEFASTP